MRDHIFISYRRDDARGASGRLYDWLRIAFGREHVFRDVHSIGLGQWRDKIDQALARSAVCLAIVGPRWAQGENLTRLHDEADMVRHELATALAAVAEGLTPVPTLVEGAGLPAQQQLPELLRPLFGDWNARTVTEEGWEDDTRRLIAEIAEAARLQVAADLESILQDAGAASTRIAALEAERNLQADQIKALAGTIDDLTRKLADAGSTLERAALTEAFAALARGDTLEAEDAFEREFEARAHADQAERRAMADAARNVANLAMLRDVGKAAAFYQKALDAQPDDADTARLLGEALVVLGDLYAAKQALQASLDLARGQGNVWVEMAAHNGIGDVLVAQGDLAGALAAYCKGLAIAEALAARDAANTGWQRDLSVSHDKIGDVLVAQGDLAGALAAYRKGLAIAQALAARDAANTQWQIDVAISCAKLGTHASLPKDQRGSYLARGLNILTAIKRDGRLPPNQDWIQWFNDALRELDDPDA